MVWKHAVFLFFPVVRPFRPGDFLGHPWPGWNGSSRAFCPSSCWIVCPAELVDGGGKVVDGPGLTAKQFLAPSFWESHGAGNWWFSTAFSGGFSGCPCRYDTRRSDEREEWQERNQWYTCVSLWDAETMKGPYSKEKGHEINDLKEWMAQWMHQWLGETMVELIH